MKRRIIVALVLTMISSFSFSNNAKADTGTWALVENSVIYAVHACFADVCGPSGSFTTNRSTMAEISRNAGCPTVCSYVEVTSSWQPTSGGCLDMSRFNGGRNNCAAVVSTPSPSSSPTSPSSGASDTSTTSTPIPTPTPTTTPTPTPTPSAWTPPADSSRAIFDDDTYSRICLSQSWSECAQWTIYDSSGSEKNRVVGPFPVEKVKQICGSGGCGGGAAAIYVLTGRYYPTPTPTPSPTPTQSQTQTSIPTPTTSQSSSNSKQPCSGGSGRTVGLPQCLMPENLPGTTWNEVSNSTGLVINGAVCSASVCGINGEWRNMKNANGKSTPNGYPENSTYIQSPTNGASWGKYYTNGVYETSNGDVYQPGSLTPETRQSVNPSNQVKNETASVVVTSDSRTVSTVTPNISETRTTGVINPSNSSSALPVTNQLIPTVIAPTIKGSGTQFGGYAVIHPDGHVCGVTVSNGAFVFNSSGTMPIEYMGCPIGSALVFQTKPSPSGNVAGWHGTNILYSDGIFYITSNGKVSTTIKDGIATDSDGRVWDTGSGATITPAKVEIRPVSNETNTVIVSTNSNQVETVTTTSTVTTEKTTLISSEETTTTTNSSNGLSASSLKIESGDSPNTKEVTGTSSDIKQVVKVITVASQEVKAITSLVNSLDTLKQPSSKSTAVLLPKSTRVEESAVSQTPQVCTVVGMTVKSLQKGTCVIVYSVSDSAGNVYNTTKTLEFKK